MTVSHLIVRVTLDYASGIMQPAGGNHSTQATQVHYIYTTDDSSRFQSTESISGRLSPDIWTEPVPKLTQFVASNRSSLVASKERVAKPGQVNFEKSDISLLSEFSSLSPKGILEKLEELEQIAYELGVQELHEVNRGRFLDIFGQAGLKPEET